VHPVKSRNVRKAVLALSGHSRRAQSQDEATRDLSESGAHCISSHSPVAILMPRAAALLTRFLKIDRSRATLKARQMTPTMG